MVFVSGGHIRRALFITLINGLVFAWLLSPLLFGDAYINHTDAGVSDYPFMALFHSRIGETGIVWNDLSGLGFPSLFIHGFLFQPLLWVLLLIADPANSLHLSMFLYAWLGSALVACALLRMGYRTSAAWLGSLVFPFVLWGWLFEPTFAFFLPLFGAACLAVSVMAKRPVASAWSCAAIVALSFLSLQAHYAVLLLIAILLLWIARRACIPAMPEITRADIHFTVGLVIGLCISAFRMLPLAAYAALSTRQGSFLDSYLKSYAIGGGYFLRYIFPSSPLPLSEGAIANIPFLGIGVLLLAVFGILIGRNKTLIFSYLAISAFVISLAFPSSITYGALRLIPFVEQLGDPTRYLIIPQLILIALAVEGLQTLSFPKTLRIVKVCSIVIIAVSSLLFVVGVTPPDPGYLLSLSNTDFAWLTIGGLLTGILLHVFQRRRFGGEFDHAIIAAIAFFLFLQGYRGTYASGPQRNFEFVPPATILSDADATVFPFLVYKGFGASPLYPYFVPESKYQATRSLLVPNTNLLQGIHNITMFDHIQTERLDAMLAAIGSESSHVARRENEILPGIEQLQQQLIKRWHILKRLGISHIITPLQLTGRREVTSIFLLPEAYGYDDNGAIFGYQASTWAHVYEVPDTRLHLSSPAAVEMILPDGKDARDRILKDVKGEVTVIECRDCDAGRGKGEVRLILLERTPVLTRASVETTSRQWIVIRRQLLPGWRVSVDGIETKAAIADSVLIAVSVPAGKHEVAAAFSIFDMLKDSVVLLLFPKSTPWFS